MLTKLAKLVPLLLALVLVAGLSGRADNAPLGTSQGSASHGPELSLDVTSDCTGGAPGMANPAATYCEELGYEYQIVDTPGGQYGICDLPDGSRCDAWRFLQGKCGKDYSHCARQGYDLITKADGKNPFSREYSVCVLGQKEIGAATELLGLSEKATRGTFPVLQSPAPSVGEGSVGSPPSSFDWRTHEGQDWMTPVKNQGSCGSCWAFSTVGVVEAVYNIATGNPDLDLNLSEEYLVSDCFWGDSCCGGWMEAALNFVRDYGISDEACFPYVDQGGCTCGGGTCDTNCAHSGSGVCSDATCSDRCVDWQDRLASINTVGWTSPSQVKQSVFDNGPLTVAMGYGGAYGGYWDGDIYRCTSDSGVNHGVIIAGYNDAGGYWIVKNSWGSGWNGDGYFKVGYGECAIEQYVNYAQVSASSDGDGDTIPDGSDNCPETSNPGQEDYDGDGVPGTQPPPGATWGGDACDADDDNDTVLDGEDIDPLNEFACQDLDADTCDDCSVLGQPDVSQDGTDTDSDGACDIGDPDDDNDNFDDAVESYTGTDPLDDCPDSPSDDAWPADINMDTAVDIPDILLFLDTFPSCQGAPPYSQRLDLVPDGCIDVLDALTLLLSMPSTCTNP